jgi:tRNA pseudouridine65 synthase
VRELAALFMERQVKKTYLAVVRGYLEDEGRIDLPLEIRGSPELAESITEYRTLARLELPIAVSTRYPTSRYSLLEVKPHTGRWHQIRRHFDRVSHPLIGDVEHGDSHHNRFFRDQLNLGGLCLRATRLEFTHPWSGMPLLLEAPEHTKWQRLTRLFAGGERPEVDFSRDVENSFELVQRGKANVG